MLKSGTAGSSKGITYGFSNSGKVKLARVEFIIVILLLSSCLSLVVGMNTVAADQDGDYIYTVSDGCATITGYTGAGGDITIPSTLGGYPVVAIGQFAFSHCTVLTSVVIPDSVTSIGNCAFNYCTALTSVTIGNHVTTIGDWAFQHCDALTSVVIPDSVIAIASNVFYYCLALASVTIGNGVTTIGDSAFTGCRSLTSVVIPDSVTSMGGGVFFHCEGLTWAVIGNGVTTIRTYAFGYCYALASVTIGNRVTTIEGAVFSSCRALTSMTFYGFTAPTSVGERWIEDTAPGIQGHAYAASNFPAPGEYFYGLLMGGYIAEPQTAVITFSQVGVPEGITAHITADSIEHELPFSAEYVMGTSLSFEYDSVVYETGTEFVLASAPSWISESNQYEARFGFSVSSAGDVNGDGFDDVIIGAYDYDSGQIDEGCAFVYHGSPTGFSTSPAWRAEGNQPDSVFGYSVSSAGDVNGDGFDDVIVGARFYDDGQLDEGCAFVYHGSSAGLSTSAAWIVGSDQEEAFLGWSVSSAGDVNGDGFDDVIVGAPYYDNGEFGEGCAFVYHGSSTGLSTSPAWMAESNQVLAHLGNSVSSAGDVNGDGYDDVIIGAYGYTNGETSEGRAYVYHGSSTGLSTSPVWTAEGNQAGALFGMSVSCAGDVNGDGFDDVIVGAHLYDNGEQNEGRAFVYHGSSVALSASAAWMAEGNQEEAYFGLSVSCAGDVNGDGFDDVIVGAESYSNGEENEGRAFVHHGSPTGLSASAAWTAEGGQANAFFGCSVSSAGDVNGDGFDDIIIGAYGYDNGEGNEGRAFVHQSTPSDVRYVLVSVSHESPLLVTESLTVTGYYEREYPAVFSQSGLGEDAIGTVMTVGGVSLTHGDLPYLTWVVDGETIAYSYEAVVPSGTDIEYVLTSVLGPASPITVVAPVTIVGSYVLGEKGPPADKTGSRVFYPPSDGWWRAKVVNHGLHSIYLTVIDLGSPSEPILEERVNFMKLDCYPEGTAYSSSVYMLAGHAYEISITPYGDGYAQVIDEFTPDTDASSLSVSLLGAIGVSSGVLLFAVICLGPYLLTRVGRMAGRELPVPNATRRTYVRRVRVLRDMTDRDWSS